MDGTKLLNRGELWQSSDEWKLINNTETNDTLFYIENTSMNTTFTITEDNIVELKPIKPSGHEHLWKKTIDKKESSNGYFKLSIASSGKVLTAITSKNLAVKGCHFILFHFLVTFLFCLLFFIPNLRSNG